MKEWKTEEIRFLKEYFKDYKTREIAEELNISVKEVTRKAIELKIIKSNTKKCLDCNEIKDVSQFYIKKASGDGYQYYCKQCEAIRKRNRSIMKKIKNKIDSDLGKEAMVRLIKESIKDTRFECPSCNKLKLGKDYYFCSRTMKRYVQCKDCRKKYIEEREIAKIMKRGY